MKIRLRDESSEIFNVRAGEMNPEQFHNFQWTIREQGLFVGYLEALDGVDKIFNFYVQYTPEGDDLVAEMIFETESGGQEK